MESLLASCLCHGSHSSGFSAAPLKQVLELTAYHLATEESETLTGLKKEGLLSEFKDMAFPVLSVPGAQWPEAIAKWAPYLCNFERTCNKDMIDIAAYHISGEALTQTCVLSGESKWHTNKVGSAMVREILDRVPADSPIHIVLSTPLVKRVTFREGSFHGYLNTN